MGNDYLPGGREYAALGRSGAEARCGGSGVVSKERGASRKTGFPRRESTPESMRRGEFWRDRNGEMGKNRKSKAEKRFIRKRREFAVSDDNGDSRPKGWERRAAEAFNFYMMTILRCLKEQKEFQSENKADLYRLICVLGRLAWNIATDSDSLEEAKERIRAPGGLPLPLEMAEDYMNLLDTMVTFRWILYPGMDAYIDDVEFRGISSDSLSLNISVSRRG